MEGTLFSGSNSATGFFIGDNVMHQWISLFGQFYRKGLKYHEAYNLVVDYLGINSLFDKGVDLGVNPCDIPRVRGKSWEVCFRMETKRREAQKYRDKINNCAVAVGAGCIWLDKVKERMYRVIGTPYIIGLQVRALEIEEHMKIQSMKNQKKEIISAGVESTPTMAEVLSQRNCVQNGGNQVYPS